MHQDLLQLQACQKPFSLTKHKSQDYDIPKFSLIDARGKMIEKLPISQEHFWAIILSLDKNDINNFGPKGQPFKTILTWEETLQLGRPSMAYIIARSRQIVKKRTKEKLIVMSCTWKIRLILNKNQESEKEMLKKMMEKLHKYKSFFSCKELLFSLGNCVWNEKWPSFTIPSLM